MRVDELSLPEGVAEILAREGIEDLYPPQQRAVPAALEGKNLVVAAPTASGKSLIAYLAALKHALERGGKVLYIVPLKALATEKQEDLERFGELGMRVALSVGDYDTPDPRLEDFDVIVATSEKADSLLRHRSGWLSRISLVVADEIHLIHDPGRGPTLEVTLAKFRKFNPRLQVIALSATIKNASALAEWLDAELVDDDWRPVKLKEGIYLEGRIHFTDNTSREIERVQDPVWSLIRDVVQEGGQCLVFVNTRRSTESLATKYAKRMGELVGRDVDTGEMDEETTMARKLKSCVSMGMAFHNAGLTSEQRRGVEHAFKKGDIKCIVATPTLAAGINLPARRVVVRDVHRFEGGYGYASIPVLEIKQMCGRAGRPRYDPWGEAVLLAKNEEEMMFLMDSYLLNETEEIYSKLGSEPAMRSHVLATIATGTADSRDSLLQFLGTTFFAHQTELYHLEDSMDRVLEFLYEEDMIRGEEQITTTFFGKRVSDLYIDPLSAVLMRDALRVMKGEEQTLGVLHAICSVPDMLSMYLRRGEYERMEEVLMAREGEMLLGPPEDPTDYEFFLSDLKTAIVLEDWIEEKDEDSILKHYNIGPGDLRNKVETADWLLYSMREMANIFNKDAYPVVTEIISRVRYGVRRELLPLTALKGVGRSRGRSLFGRGLRNATELRGADLSKLSRVPGIGQALAIKIKEQVGEPVKDGDLTPLETEEDQQDGQQRLDDF